MSQGLEAIANELRRLQREGVDRIFVEDQTLGLLKPAVEPQAQARQIDKADGPAATSADLEKLVASQSNTTSISTPTNSAKKTAHTPAASTSQPIPETPPTLEIPEGAAAEQMQWLRERVESCPVCNEHLSKRGKVVFGTGNPQADILFCGEAPGADEELAGEPFVGKAGQLLTKIIGAMGLSREAVYIANILKWRPEHNKPYGNRPPTIEEMNYCLPYLRAQIQIVQPKVIIALGNTAVTGLLGSDPDRRMGSIRGTWASFQEIPLMITFHPSYLLRNDTLKTKRMVWEDMLQVMQKTDLEISEKQQGYFLPKS